ncbi:4-hydroxy-3-methylbut-2-enyl diphosphate reductase [Candidatus Magnetaquicoccus inordinatus]|uniref:4-hydroxy-3-methylbut-2-enyl diphosphate reductase n=1 Tax=Candidatus Magnetaquicoccus inordinatus TaxID=2496818 RepID=UPI00102C3708|nr:4-hydroxy-3-methylbut-2-enyl diphosphate reductase [Candidatus Magnetaquicoccus inordinatus]
MRIILAEPRGFCAGVDRAIAIVESALAKFAPPIYVRHEIVHNRWVVDALRRKGAIFVQELPQVPEEATVIFSAHGVAKEVEEEARRRNLRVLDATCPLVGKVHRAADRLDRSGHRLILIGHPGHPEVVGTLGQLPEGEIELVSKVEDVLRLPKQTEKNSDSRIAYITQTTLSLDETAGIVAALQERFPEIIGPAREDICYATQNRQNAVKALAQCCELILVLGAPNSSNSNRLKEVALRAGVTAHLIESAHDIDPQWLHNLQALGITAGASAPEILVDELLTALTTPGDRLYCADAEAVELLSITKENLVFSLPEALRN